MCEINGFKINGKVPLFREVFFYCKRDGVYCLDNACRLPDKRSSETSSKYINLCKY